VTTQALSKEAESIAFEMNTVMTILRRYAAATPIDEAVATRLGMWRSRLLELREHLAALAAAEAEEQPTRAGLLATWVCWLVGHKTTVRSSQRLTVTCRRCGGDVIIEPTLFV
jgi:hypothetical protein